jgi:ribosomal-protein-alanine N-acetyltransferase
MNLAGTSLRLARRSDAPTLAAMSRDLIETGGIGRRMTQWLVETAVTAGIATLHVELRVQNKAAYSFYRALGFEQTLHIAGYYGGRETAIRMMRLLRTPGLLPLAWRPPTLDKQ